MSDTSVENDDSVYGGMRRRTLLGAGAASAALAMAWGRLGHAHAAPLDAPTTGWGSGVKVRFFAGGNAGDAFASIVFNGAQQAQADLGVSVDYIFSGWDVSKMTDQLREAIAAQPDGIAMMGHPGDDALLPLAQQAHDADILMEYQNVDLPKVRQQFGGGYIGADLTPQGIAVGTTAVQKFGLKAGDKAIVFGAWGQPGRFFREEGTAKALEDAGVIVNRIVSPPEAGQRSQPPDANPDSRVSERPGHQADLPGWRSDAVDDTHLYAGDQQGAGRDHQHRLRPESGDHRCICSRLGPAHVGPAALSAGLLADPVAGPQQEIRLLVPHVRYGRRFRDPRQLQAWWPIWPRPVFAEPG